MQSQGMTSDQNPSALSSLCFYLSTADVYELPELKTALQSEANPYIPLWSTVLKQAALLLSQSVNF